MNNYEGFQHDWGRTLDNNPKALLTIVRITITEYVRSNSPPSREKHCTGKNLRGYILKGIYFNVSNAKRTIG